VLGPLVNHDHIFVLSKTFMCFEMGPLLQVEGGSVYYWSLPLCWRWLERAPSPHPHTHISSTNSTHPINHSRQDSQFLSSLYWPIGRSGKLLLAVASTFILGSETRGTHDSESRATCAGSTSSALEMEATCSSETSANFQRTTWPYVSEL
jgi:hypothetical protein